MQRPKHCLGIASIACLVTCYASPCAAFALSVERGPGTEDCPDSVQLTARVRELRGQDANSDATTYAVRFNRDGNTLSAEIRVGEAQVRVLKARTETCAALARGAAVTVAMLLDTDASPQRSRAAAPGKDRLTEPPEPRHTAPLSKESRQSALRLRGWFSASAGGLFGVLGNIAPELSAEAGMGARAFRIGLGGFWGAPRKLSLSPGYVSESLGAGTLRICWNSGWQEPLSPGLCVGAMLGEIHGEAHGFTLDEHHDRAWLALPVEVSLAKLDGTLGWELTASALIEVVEHDFGVAGAGTAYRSPALGGILALHGIVSFLR